MREVEGLSFIVAEPTLEPVHLQQQYKEQKVKLLVQAAFERKSDFHSFDPVTDLHVERVAPMRMISLEVHSSLQMFGLTAALSREMAAAKRALGK